MPRLPLSKLFIIGQLGQNDPPLLKILHCRPTIFWQILQTSAI